VASKWVYRHALHMISAEVCWYDEENSKGLQEKQPVWFLLNIAVKLN